MAKNLVIVESPAKAKTIEKFLGSDFEVRASMGHIIDLPTRKLGVDTERNFAPEYVVIEKKETLLKDLKAASKKAETVYLAPDPDREGEFIAWALKEQLGLKQPRRAVFNEITKNAVRDAIAHPRDIDENLLNAQQARRVLDRLVGFKISPLLWRRVQRGTSAGRVQSVALRLICERENDIRAFIPEEYWTIAATLRKRDDHAEFIAQLIGRQNTPELATDSADDLAAETTAESATDAEANSAATDGKGPRAAKPKFRITSQEQASAILSELDGAAYTVQRVERKDVRRQPFLPYTTSTLQQDASVRLRFKPKRTMSLAQELYEGVDTGEAGHQGLITYMRTDSTRISAEAQTAVKGYIEARFAKEYVGPGRTGKSKATTQDAHEAIRPTDVNLTPEQMRAYLTPDQLKLYQLIWRRFVASFMAPAVFDTVRADIGAANYVFRATGSTLKFPGFYAIWPREEDGDTLPPLAEREPLDLRKLAHDQHFTQPPARFTEASLIKELEERGIGRPSTYVPIVSTIQDRGYVELQERRFTPTWLGETVNELMTKHFTDIVDVNFTVDMERRLDAVEGGEREWTAFLRDFYAALSGKLKDAEDGMERVQKPVEELGEACPDCGKPLLIRTGRFGKFISCSGYPECSYKRAITVKTGAICPSCGGDLVERKSRKSNKVFYGCANYPTCNFAVWDKPLSVPCPECGSLLTLGANKTEAACVQCGALVQGALEGAPEVVGRQTPELERRAARSRAAATSAEQNETTEGAAKPAPRRRAAAAAARSTTTRSTTTRSTTTRARATTATKSGAKTTRATTKKATKKAPAKPKATTKTAAKPTTSATTKTPRATATRARQSAAS